MSELQMNRWDRLMRRIGNIVGARSIVTTALEDVFPILNMEDRSGELMLLGQKRLSGGGTFSAAVVGERSFFGLQNPVDSGHIIVITMMAFDTTSTQVRINVDLAAFATTNLSGTKNFRDLRLTGSPVGALVADSQVATMAAYNTWRPVPGQVTLFNHRAEGWFVLAPGSAINVQNEGANLGITGSWEWYERVLEESELNL